jgi:diguanylate cyclase (GGDEF)-like protein
MVHPDDRERMKSEDGRPGKSGGVYATEYRVVHRDGRIKWVRNESVMIEDEVTGTRYWQGFMLDITKRKQMEEQLQHQALHDPLTDLPNRILFTDRLRHALARAERRQQCLSVMFMDLDNFKVINDSLGHETGDKLLVIASKRIRSVLRPEDTVARLGGDEFVFLLEDTDLDGASRIAERILELLRRPFFLGGRELFIMASIGIAVGDGSGKRSADLLRDADLAMYRAKHSGKARYAVFEETMNAQALERLELEHGLRRAVERNEFVVHYQPEVSLANRKIVGFEALARWEHPENGLMLPEQFVSLAEETGLIVPIGEAVLEAACRQATEWREQRPSDPPAVCVNLSARQFRELGLTKSIARIIDSTGLEPSSLFLEVTESTAMRDALATAAALEELQTLGVRTILDDFGTGYSSLSYLERFPVEYIKIDHSFVGGLGEYPGAEMLVSAIISLAHALGHKVIAEGVETEEQFEQLREMGCDLAQGHLISEPLSAEGVADLLAAAQYRNPSATN